MPTLTDIVNELAAALAAAETAEDALAASAGANAVYADALRSSIARFRVIFMKDQETKAALEPELTKRTASMQAVATAYAGKVAGLKTEVNAGGHLAASVLTTKAGLLTTALGVADPADFDDLVDAVADADAEPVTALTGKQTAFASARALLDTARSTEGTRRSELEAIEARILFLSDSAAQEGKAALESLACVETELATAAVLAGDAKKAALLRAVVQYHDLAARRKRLIDPIGAGRANTPFDVDNANANDLRDKIMEAWNTARDALTAAAGARFVAEKAVFAAEVEALKAERDLAAYQADRLERAAEAVKVELGP